MKLSSDRVYKMYKKRKLILCLHSIPSSWYFIMYIQIFQNLKNFKIQNTSGPKNFEKGIVNLYVVFAFEDP